MLTEETKTEIKKRLLSKYELKKIILFGSQARGTADERSDVDLLVIADLAEDKFEVMDTLRNALSPINLAFDIVVLTQEEFEKDKKYPGTLSRYVSKEGILIYEQ